MHYQVIRFLNTLWIYILSGVLLGAYTYQFVEQQDPCPLCELQRLSMICVAIGPFLNLQTGVRSKHYALSFAAAVFGASVSLRQISLHVCPQFRTFGYPVLGLELYTWAFIVFVCSILGGALLLALHKAEFSKLKPKCTGFEWAAQILICVIALMNVATTFLQCGIGPCSG